MARRRQRKSLALLVLLALFAAIAPARAAPGFSDIVAAIREGRLDKALLTALVCEAKAGNARASQLVAWLLATGREVPEDRRLAFAWYLEAYLQGLPAALSDARIVLAHMDPAEIRSFNPAVIRLAETGLIAKEPGRRPLGAAAAEAGAVRALLRSEAVQAHLMPALAEAVGYVESRFQADALSPKGARGVMQIMPATGLGLAVAPDSLFDARENVRAGVRYLDQLIQQYGRIDKALAHYVGGSAAAAAYPAASPEVRNYVADVLQAAPQFEALNGAPLSAGTIARIRRGGLESRTFDRPLAKPAKSVTRQGSVLILRGIADH